MSMICHFAPYKSLYVTEVYKFRSNRVDTKAGLKKILRKFAYNTMTISCFSQNVADKNGSVL